MTMETQAPSLENGFTQLANELLEAMCRAGFSARQWAVVMSVIRKTYGYGKKSDDISLGQLSSMTGIAKSHLSRTVNDLIAAGVLRRSEGVFGNSLSINKRYKKWAVGMSTNGVTDSVTQRVTEKATGVTESVTSNGVTESVTGVTDLVGVTDSVTQGLPIQEPQNNTIQKKEKHSRAILADGTPENPSGSPSKVVEDLPSAEFLTAWGIYPKRDGGNPRKAAWKAWKARLRAGDATAEELIFATRGYAEYCEAQGKLGSRFVMHASTFYGPDGHWEGWRQTPTSSEDDGLIPWWAEVGFSGQVEAENAGCTEGNRWMWENRMQVRTEQDRKTWLAAQSQGGAA